MAVETYTTVNAVRTSLGMPIGDGPYPDDADLTRSVAGASKAINDVTGRRFWRDDNATARSLNPYGKTVWNSPGEHLLLTPDIAVVDMLLIELGQVGAVTWSALTGSWEPQYRGSESGHGIAGRDPINGILLVNGEWPCTAGARVRVTAVWGWPAVPANIVTATEILARRLFKRKDSPGGVLGSQEWVTNLARKDPDVQELVQHFELPGFG